MLKHAKVIGSGISYEVYSRQADGVTRGNKDFIMSRSELVEFSGCPARWIAGAADDEDTDSTFWGNLIDCMALTPEKFIERYAVSPAQYKDAKTGKMKDWTFAANVCKAWREDHKGKEVINVGLKAKADQALKAIEESDIDRLIDSSRTQVMCVAEWLDKATGIVVPLRVLIDMVPDVDCPAGKWLCDLKTSRNGNPDHWARVVDDCAYDVQAALSMDIYLNATGEDRTDWVFPLQENIPPFHVVTPMPALTMEFLEYGRQKYRQALAFYAQCLQTGDWPSYSTGERIVMNGLQLIGPEEVWNYRKTAGQGSGRMADLQPITTPLARLSDETIEFSRRVADAN